MLKKLMMLGLILIGFCTMGKGEYYYYKTLAEVTAENELPDSLIRSETELSSSYREQLALYELLKPYVMTKEKAEVFLYWQDGEVIISPILASPSNTYIAVCSESGSVTGTIAVAVDESEDIQSYQFDMGRPNPDQEQAKKDFLKAKSSYYYQRKQMDIPGAAWFRYQYNQLPEYEPDSSEDEFGPMIWEETSDFDDTFSLFSGGRAISENLQLDRDLRVQGGSEATVELSSLTGITTAAIDWKPLVKDLQVKKDSLAKIIPNDQYAVFFPSFKAMQEVTSEADNNGTPILGLLEAHSEDALTQQRLENQLCLQLTAFSRILGPAVIRSMAFTGSDPYLRMGSDLSVLFDCSSPEMVQSNVLSQHAKAAAQAADTKTASGTIDDIKYQSVISPDRRICSFLARVNDYVIVSNSLTQLERIIKTTKGQIPNIADLDEYTFFRDRYKAGTAEESALVILSDATIRRWCSPQWRIANSRRIKAAAVIADLQCSVFSKLVAGIDKPYDLKAEDHLKWLGELTVNSSGVNSSIYGNLNFFTPISEIAIEKVTQQEADAYAQFKQNYQNNWRQFFDPIAIQLTQKDNILAMDMTIMPLIAESEYRQFIDVVGNNKLEPGQGDTHKEAILHLILSLDIQNPTVSEMTNMVSLMAPTLGSNPMSWLGKSVSLYLDDDPLWKEIFDIQDERQRSDFLEENIYRLPIALDISVNNQLKLAGFLVAMRAYIEQSAPDMTKWESLKYNEQAYVKISPNVSSLGLSDNIAIYYASTNNSLIITLSEATLKRALDRKIKRSSEPNWKPAAEDQWLGESMALKYRQSMYNFIAKYYNEALNQMNQRKSWSNLIILNELKRTYPDQNPVELYQKYWNIKLTCPGGGEYIWDEQLHSMKSTVYGCPLKPELPNNFTSVYDLIKELDLGITFEKDGLRAKGRLKR